VTIVAGCRNVLTIFIIKLKLAHVVTESLTTIGFMDYFYYIIHIRTECLLQTFRKPFC
jgi:hypothetical protein